MSTKTFPAIHNCKSLEGSMITHQFCTFLYKPFRKSQVEILFSYFMDVKAEVQDLERLTGLWLGYKIHKSAQFRVHV